MALSPEDTVRASQLMTAGIPSRFKFDESIGQKPPLPRSDYYRAQHMLNQLWGQTSHYFQDRPQPTFDPQLRPGVKDPQGFPVPPGWSGIAYPRSTALSPNTWTPTNIPDLRGMTSWRVPVPEGQLPQPGVYGLNPWVVANLAHPSQYPAALPEVLRERDRITGRRPLDAATLGLQNRPALINEGDVLPRNPYVIAAAASVPIHEWAHNFQSAGTLANQRQSEGGAEAFSRIVGNQAMRGLGLSPVYEPWGYPAWTQSILHDWKPEQILRNQFRYSH